MKRALIVKLGAIGDVVMAIPAVHELHALGYEIDWIANAASAEVLSCYSFVRVIAADDQKLIRGGMLERLRELRAGWEQLHGRTYDLVATLYYDRRYRLFSLPVRGAQHVRLVKGDRALELHHGRHHTDEFARILLSAVVGDARDAGPVPESLAPLAPSKLPPAPLPASAGTRIALAPGGARNLLRDDELRRWPIGNYVELARLLLAAGHEVVVTGGPGDAWVRDAFEGLPCTDLIGQLSLPKLLALFEASDAVVTHDSGPLHLAGVTSCALLGIFGPVNPWGRLPRRPGTVALWGGEAFACRPCYDGSTYADCRDNQCMAQITPQMAFAAVAILLEQKAAGTLCSPAVHLPSFTPSLVAVHTLMEAKV